MSDATTALDAWRQFPCKIWTGAINGHGYGHHVVRGSKPPKWKLAHREALEQKLGRSIRPGYFALHHCDVRACCEPEHLYEGTQRQNMRDMSERGRQRQQKVTPAQREEICQRYAAGGVTHRQLAAEYGMARVSISGIIGRAAAAAAGATSEPVDEPALEAPGEHRHTKLTEQDVRDARRRYADGETVPALALEYGVSRAQMHRVLKRRCWASVA